MDVSTAVTLDPEKSYEIVDGQPEEKEMAGARHGRVVMRLGARLEMHVEQHQLGGMYLSKSNFTFFHSVPTNRQEGSMKKFMLRYI